MLGCGQSRLIGLRATGTSVCCTGTRVRSILVPPLLTASLYGIGDKDQLIVDRYRRAQEDTRVRLDVVDGLYGSTKLNGACLPSVRTAR